MVFVSKAVWQQQVVSKVSQRPDATHEGTPFLTGWTVEYGSFTGMSVSKTSVAFVTFCSACAFDNLLARTPLHSTISQSNVGAGLQQTFTRKTLGCFNLSDAAAVFEKSYLQQ